MAGPTLIHYDVSDADRVRNSLTTLSERLHHSLFRWFAAPGDFSLPDGKVDLSLVGSTTPCLQFPSGEDSAAYTVMSVNDYVVAGEMHVELLYTGTSTTNAFDISVAVTGLTDGALADAGTETVNDTSVAAPGAAKRVMLVTFSPFTVNQLDEAFTVKVQRNGSSESPANSGDFRLLGMKLRFYASQL